jgi:nucleoside-diphosphate-sugar epimerase
MSTNTDPPNTSSGKILVTGASGLVGKALIGRLLASGNRVVATVHRNPLQELSHPLLEKKQCDLLDVIELASAMYGIEKLYHCAAVVSYNPAHRKQMYALNVEGTAHVVNTALDAGVKKLIHVSSVATLSSEEKGVPVTEGVPWQEEKGKSAYARSKYLAEMEVWRGIAEGLNAVIVNPSIILGEGDWNGGSTRLFKSVYEGFPWYSEGVSGFVDVRDVALAMQQLMESDVQAERFIVSQGNYSYRQILDLIAGAYGSKPPGKKVTPFLAGLVWRMEALKKLFGNYEPLITRETAAHALEKVEYDNRKLLEFLPGFTYRSIEETIDDTARKLLERVGKKTVA